MLNIVMDLERHLLGQGLAHRTVTEYCKWGRRLARWCVVHDLDLARLEPWELRAWVDSTVPHSRESRKQAHAACRHLFTMLGRGDEQPWTAIRVPHKRRGRPRPLTEPERVRMLQTAQMMGGRAGLATLGMLQTSCRPSEVAVWRWDGITLFDEPDVAGACGRLRFYRTKVSDWHEVPLRPSLATALERFRPPTPEGHIFVGDRGRQHVHPNTVWDWVKEVARVAGVDDVHPRRLRATAITRVLESSGLDVAAELGGHQDPSVTRNYYAATSWIRLAEGSAALD